MAGESAEDDFNGGAVGVELIRLGIALEDEELHGVARRVKYVVDVLFLNTVAVGKGLEEVDALWRELPDGIGGGELGLALYRLDEAGEEELVAEIASHGRHH